MYCWKDESEHCAEIFGFDSDEYVNTIINCGGTCMLPHDHEGDHEFTPDSDINITFKQGS